MCIESEKSQAIMGNQEGYKNDKELLWQVPKDLINDKTISSKFNYFNGDL